MNEPTPDVNNNKTRNDFLFFQNEILTDLKKVEQRVNEKMSRITTFLTDEKKSIDSKIQEFTSKFDEMQTKKLEFTEQINNSLNALKLKYEDYISKNEIRVSMVQKDLSNACFKYDKMFTNNLTTPGLIGECCTYATLPPFLEYVNSKINELLTSRDKKNMEYKKYKEKIESLIGQNKLQLEVIENKFKDYCNTCITECENKFEARLNITEERINRLRLENGKYALDLIKKGDELKIEWNKLQEFESMLDINFKSELEKHYEINENVLKNFEKYREEFNVIKVKFTELNEFIKDIRFKKSLKYLMNERQSYKDQSEKANYNKKQKIREQEKYNNNASFYNNSSNEIINTNNNTNKYGNVENIDDMSNNSINNKNLNNNSINNKIERLQNVNEMNNNVNNKFENIKNAKEVNNNSEIIGNRIENTKNYKKIETEENNDKNDRNENQKLIEKKKQKINQKKSISPSINANNGNKTHEVNLLNSFNENIKSVRSNNDSLIYNRSCEIKCKKKKLDKNTNIKGIIQDIKKKSFSNSPNAINNKYLNKRNFNSNQSNDYNNNTSMNQNNNDNNNINQYYNNFNTTNTNNNSSRNNFINANIINISSNILNNSSNNININYKSSQNKKKLSDFKYNSYPSKLLEDSSNININNLILGANFDAALPPFNLSHAYVFVKKKNDNLQNLNIYFGNNNTYYKSNTKKDKFSTLSPANFNKTTNKNPSLLFKNNAKNSLEDLFNAKKKKEKMQELINKNNNGICEINRERIKEDNNKNNLPKLVFSSTIGNSPHNSSSDNVNKGYQKKLQKSSSDIYSPIRMRIKIKGDEVVDKEGEKNNKNVNQEMLNKLNPFLIKKFQE